MARTALAGACLATAALVTAGPASAATQPTVQELLTPERRALLDPLNFTANRTATVSGDWSTLVTRDGAVRGRPGNRHVDSLKLTDDGRGNGLQVQVSSADSQCTSAGACTSLQSLDGSGPAPAGTTAVPGGTARISLFITDSTPGVTVTRAPGVPVRPFTVNMTITPRQPVNPAAATYENSDVQANVQSLQFGEYQVIRSTKTPLAARVSGALFGLTLGPADSGAVNFSYFGTVQQPLLTTVTTAAGRRAWLPPIAAGKIADDISTSHIGGTGHISGRLTTSTGKVLAGNRHVISIGLDAARAETTSQGVFIESRTCATTAQAWADCVPVPAEEQTWLETVGTPASRVLASGRTTITTVLGAGPLGEAGVWGNLQLVADAAPSAVGIPRREIQHFADGAAVFRPGTEILIDTKFLQYSSRTAPSTPPNGSVTLGGRQALITEDGDSYELTLGYRVVGVTPRP